MRNATSSGQPTSNSAGPRLDGLRGKILACSSSGVRHRAKRSRPTGPRFRASTPACKRYSQRVEVGDLQFAAPGGTNGTHQVANRLIVEVEASHRPCQNTLPWASPRYPSRALRRGTGSGVRASPGRAPDTREHGRAMAVEPPPSPPAAPGEMVGVDVEVWGQAPHAQAFAGDPVAADQEGLRDPLGALLSRRR